MNRMVGWILVVAGILQMIVAGSMDVTAPGELGVANIDLMEQRALVFWGGGFAFLGGCIALAAERVRSAVLSIRLPDQT